MGLERCAGKGREPQGGITHYMYEHTWKHLSLQGAREGQVEKHGWEAMESSPGSWPVGNASALAPTGCLGFRRPLHLRLLGTGVSCWCRRLRLGSGGCP